MIAQSGASPSVTNVTIPLYIGQKVYCRIIDTTDKTKIGYLLYVYKNIV